MDKDSISIPTLSIPLALPSVAPLRWKVLTEIVAQVLFLQQTIPTTMRELFIINDNASGELPGPASGARMRRPTSSASSALQTFCAQWSSLCSAAWDIMGAHPVAAALISIGSNARRPKFAVFVNFERLSCLPLLTSPSQYLAMAAEEGETESDMEHITPLTDMSTGSVPMQRLVPSEGAEIGEWGGRDEDTPLQRAVARKIARILITEGPSVGLDKPLSVKCPPISVLLYLPIESGASVDERLEIKPGFILSRSVTRPYVTRNPGKVTAGGSGGGPRLSGGRRRPQQKLVEITCVSTSDAGVAVSHPMPSNTHVWAKIKVPLRGFGGLPKTNKE